MLSIPSSLAILSSCSVYIWELPIMKQLTGKTAGPARAPNAPTGLGCLLPAGTVSPDESPACWPDLKAFRHLLPTPLCVFQMDLTHRACGHGKCPRSHLRHLGLCCHSSSSVCPPFTWLPSMRRATEEPRGVLPGRSPRDLLPYHPLCSLWGQLMWILWSRREGQLKALLWGEKKADQKHGN